MRLDSFLYRLIWRTKKALGFKFSGPPPIVWGEPIATYAPPEELVGTLSEEHRRRMLCLTQELGVLSRITTHLPRTLAYHQWLRLVQIETVKERFRELIFMRQIELEMEKDEARKAQRRSLREGEDGDEGEEKEEETSFPIMQNYHGIMRTLRLEKTLQSLRYYRSMRLDETPKLVVDCRFLAHHTRSGCSQASKQISLLMVNNRRRPHPWQVYLTNFDEDNPRLCEAKRAHIGVLTGPLPVGEVTSKSYLELFPHHREQGKIVYLSPHATEELEQIEPDVCYVIGGIVDRIHEPAIHKQASLVTAEEEAIPSRRLPLSKHISWKTGSPAYLTINSVASIIQDAFDSDGDWPSVLARHIPVRKLSKHKSNPLLRQMYGDRREFNRQVLRLLIETLGYYKENATKVEEKESSHSS